MAVALYARVSTTKQTEKVLSIPDQLQQMRDWCKTHGYDIAVEYVESGASATDDRRPEFQRMIGEDTLSPPPFEAIIIHSLSRFFRDSIEFGLYERRLNKAGVKLISITQQTSEDPAGEMARRIFSLFDEYQSKENSKHTLRAMKENARQGFFNGSTPPYGYRTVEVPWGNSKVKKKRLEIDPTESAIVNNIFQLYLYGHQGLIPMDSTLQTRVHKRHARRQEILLELAGMRRQKALPLSKIGAKDITAFCFALKKRFMDKASNFSKEYLKLLVSEINVDDKQVRLAGSYSALAGALVNKSIVRDVPSFDLNWLPG